MSNGPQKHRTPNDALVRLRDLRRFEKLFAEHIFREFGMRNAMVVGQFYQGQIDPRISRLERLPWNWVALKLWSGAAWVWAYVRATAITLRARFGKAPEAPPPEAPPETPAPEAE